MGARRYLISLVLLVGLLILAGCAGVAPDDGLNQTSPEAADTTVDDGFAGLPEIPWDTGEPIHATSDAGDPGDPENPPGNIVVLGKDYLQMLNGYVDGDALVLEGPHRDDRHFNPQRPLAYGLYQVSGLLDVRPVSLNIECLASHFGDGYYVGIADYTIGRWKWFGPVTFPEFQLDLRDEVNRFVTHLGNMYFILVCPPEVTITHSKSTVVVGPEGPCNLPGKPHHLRASDGTFPEGVLLQWTPGCGAAIYEVWRRPADPPPPPPDGMGGDPGDPQPGEWTIIGHTPVPEFVDHQVPPGAPHAYKVRALNDAGASAFSNEDVGFAPDIGPRMIEGRVVRQCGNGVPGIQIELSPPPGVFGEPRFTHTDDDGYFAFPNLGPGLYLVIPHADQFIFTPPMAEVHLVNIPVAYVEFLALKGQLDLHTIKGHVVGFENPGCPPVPLAGVLITAGSPDYTLTMETNADGYFEFREVPLGGYHVTAAKEGWLFHPVMLFVPIDGVHAPMPLYFDGYPERSGD